MRSTGNLQRGSVAMMLAALSITAIAPLAEAGHAQGRRDRGGRETRVVQHVYRPAPAHRTHGAYRVRSGAAPAIAGFVGGLVLGAVLADGVHAHCAYTYRDPYCHENFPSMQAYESHCRAHHHALTVSVIAVPDGFGWDDYHFCGECRHAYWGDGHRWGCEEVDDD